MILKGIISSIDFNNQKAEVILPEYEYAVTKPLPVYGGFKASELSVKDFVLVQAFNDNIGDGIILKKSTLQDIPQATTNYNDLSNKPKINDIELIGNKTLDELGIQPKIAEVDEEEGVAEAVLPIVAPKIVAEEEIETTKIVATEAEAETLKGNLDWSYIQNKPRIPSTDEITNLITDKILQAFPIGTIIESENPVNPSTYLGGTWEAYAEGKVTVGIDANDSDFDTVGKTGGSKELQQHNHTASTESAGNHNHTASTGSAGSHNHSGTANSAGSHSHSASSNSAGSHTHGVAINKSQVEASGYSLWAGSGGFQNRAMILRSAYETYSSSGGSHSHTITVNSGGAHTHTLTINSGGAHTHTVTVQDGGSHTHDVTVNDTGTGNSGNLQPYITVYKWIRTA